MKNMFLKEVKGHLNVFYIFLAFFILVQLYFVIKAGNWSTGLPLGASLLFSLNFLFFYAFFRGYNTLRSEWQNRTSYFILSLPIRRFSILLAKLLALDLEVFIFYIIACVSAYYISKVEIPFIEIVSFGRVFLIALLILISYLIVPVLGMFVFVFARSVGRREGLLSFVGVVVLSVFYYYFSDFFHRFLDGRLSLELSYMLETKGEIFRANFPLLGFVEFIVFSLVILGITALLFGRRIEV